MIPFGHMGKIYFFFIPIGIPPVVFGILYLIYCIYMARRGTDHIGHIAHFTGSIYGFIFPILFNPALFAAFMLPVNRPVTLKNYDCKSPKKILKSMKIDLRSDYGYQTFQRHA